MTYLVVFFSPTPLHTLSAPMTQTYQYITKGYAREPDASNACISSL
jgi:hypothetical protein